MAACIAVKKRLFKSYCICL